MRQFAGLTVTHGSLTFNPLREPDSGKAVSDELPKLFSDEELDEQRRLRERRERERRELADRREEARRVSPMQGRRSTDGLPESTLEQRLPHIAKKLTALWRSEACAVYLSGLTIADRPGRQGFPVDVMEDLVMLHEINEMLMGESGLEPEAASPPRPEGGGTPRT
jgi:hypothetical protein